ncbi:MAG: hypothetical protein ACKVOR_06040 [Flavobacteriales bacterium]
MKYFLFILIIITGATCKKMEGTLEPAASHYSENLNSLESISNLFSIFTPLVVLFWFWHSYKDSLSKKYYSEINGIYAGYATPLGKATKGGKLEAALYLTIRNTDDNGYFKGEVEIREIEGFGGPQAYQREIRRDAIYTFLGKLDYKFKFDTNRHPAIAEQNHKYYGNLWFTRLDLNIDQNPQEFIQYEFSLTHYREKETLEFRLIKAYPNTTDIHANFQLHKRTGNSFDPSNHIRFLFGIGKTKPN